jgi:hypothetical protein
MRKSPKAERVGGIGNPEAFRIGGIPYLLRNVRCFNLQSSDVQIKMGGLPARHYLAVLTPGIGV